MFSKVRFTREGTYKLKCHWQRLEGRRFKFTVQPFTPRFIICLVFVYTVRTLTSRNDGEGMDVTAVAATERSLRFMLLQNDASDHSRCDALDGISPANRTLGH
jgi:hypothetical protein